LRITIARVERELQEKVEQDDAEIVRLRADVERLSSESDRIAALVRDREAELGTACAERDASRAGREGAIEETERLRIAVARVERELQEKVKQDDAEIGRLRADVGRHSSESDRLAALVRDREAELATACSDRDAIRAERENAVAEAEQLRVTFTRVERELQEWVQQDDAEIDRLRAHVERLSTESDRLAALVRDGEAELKAAVAERDRFSVERGSAKVQVDRLRLALAQMERESVERDERLGAELDRLRAMNEQLRAEAHRFVAPFSNPIRDAELQEAHARLVSLQRELVHLRHQARQMKWLAGPPAGRIEQDS
jgi:chromosome segregation ATPase